ncbi:hypothetical protein [Sphingobium phenoxybenzoativorans]|uniref:hypothetical protein n=1 Tax=Sphingobium phenoxybenzoativorans TaxID=1592790 RepID=UPI0008724D44|nr:hypothetical protein [Sphingobium phenoxybenzoativorans]
MTSDYVLIDTDTMPVEEDPRNPGKKTQLLLSREDTGGGVVRISYWPAGFTEKIRAMATDGHRHYHRSVNERHYVLGGDWTALYWPDPEGGPVPTRLTRHHYLENPPMALHGINRDMGPETGTKFLVWTSGPGTDVHEPEAATESFDVEFEGEVPPEVNSTPILFNAQDRSWLPHPQQPGWLVKELSPAQDALPAVTLVNIPAGSSAPVHVSSPDGDVKRWLFLISGDLKLDIRGKGGTVPVGLHENAFLAWRNQAEIVSENQAISDGGCVAICIGHVLGDARTA